MFTQARKLTLVLVAFAVVPIYLVCHAQEVTEATPDVVSDAVPLPTSLFTAGPVKPLRNMAGRVEVHLLRSSSDRSGTVKGYLAGLDGNWVVVRVDHMNEEPKATHFQWIPVSNIERMVQDTVHPERHVPSTNQLTK